LLLRTGVFGRLPVGIVIANAEIFLTSLIPLFAMQSVVMESFWLHSDSAQDREEEKGSIAYLCNI
jgi:esterase/lipase superfamily enzyme